MAMRCAKWAIQPTSRFPHDEAQFFNAGRRAEVAPETGATKAIPGIGTGYNTKLRKIAENLPSFG